MKDILTPLEPLPLAYSEVVKLVKIAMTIPVTTASNERLFSVLKRVKTYLRRLLHQTMNDLATYCWCQWNGQWLDLSHWTRLSMTLQKCEPVCITVVNCRPNNTRSLTDSDSWLGGGAKTRIMRLPGRERCLMISSAVWIQYSTGTWRTDGRTDTGRQQSAR